MCHSNPCQTHQLGKQWVIDAHQHISTSTKDGEWKCGTDKNSCLKCTDLRRCNVGTCHRRWCSNTNARQRPLAVGLQKHGRHGIPVVTMFSTWVKHSAEPLHQMQWQPNIIRTNPQRAIRDQVVPRNIDAENVRLDIDAGDASWKTGVLQQTLMKSNMQRDVQVEKTLTMLQFKHSSMHARMLAMTCTEIENSSP